jgi:hypothetical protein
VAFVFRYLGDTPRDAEELEAALVDAVETAMAAGTGRSDEALGATTFSGADYAFVQRSSSEILFVAASDPAAGTVLAETLQLPAPPDD